jgi:lipopolysaccharide cholinephosphotransferase
MYGAYLNPLDAKEKWKIPGRFLKKLKFSFISRNEPNKGKYVDELIIKQVKKYTSEDDCWVGCPTWSDLKRPYEKIWFEKSVDMEFENELFSVPIGYDECLRRTYGDYMKLPPEEKRVQTHDYEIVAPDYYVGIDA